MAQQVKNPTALELLEDLMEGNQSTTIIVSRAAIKAIVTKLRKEQNLTQEVDEEEHYERDH